MYEWPREENVPIDEIITKYEKKYIVFLYLTTCKWLIDSTTHVHENLWSKLYFVLLC